MSPTTIIRARISRLAALIPRLPSYLQSEMWDSLAVERERLRLVKANATTVFIRRA